ncbi:MAG: hypothetical protein AAF667_00710 [Pseudomonadota bacterium]
MERQQKFGAAQRLQSSRKARTPTINIVVLAALAVTLVAVFAGSGPDDLQHTASLGGAFRQ